MKTLTHNQMAFVPAWGKSEAFTVGTVEGYAKEDSWQTVEQAVERAIKNEHDLAYTMKPGTMLTNSKGYYEREEEKKARAVEIVEGEIVEIEGRKYKVKLMGVRYSDPVHFIAA